MRWLGGIFGRDDPTKSKDAFGKAVVKALRAAHCPEPIVLDPGKFKIAVGENQTLYLDNFFKEASAESADFLSVLNSIYETLAQKNELPDTMEAARHRLIPVIREKIYWDHAGGNAFGAGNERDAVPYKTLNQDLGIAVAWNGAKVLTTLTQAGYENWGTKFDDAYALALENLARWPFEDFYQDEPGVMVLEDEGGFATSALLLPEVLGDAGISGTPVVMMPGRNTLLLADADDEEGLRHMVDIAEEVIAKPRPLTGFSFVPYGQGWRRFPRSDEETLEYLRQVNLEWLDKTYEDQKIDIEATQNEAVEGDNFELLEQDWLFAFPATVTLCRSDGKYFTCSTWGKGLDTLLPETDSVAFLDQCWEEEDVLYAPWTAVRREFGHLMTPRGLHPERYLVTEFPDLEEIRRIETKFD